jgi:murein DD-endopeptidase MepM/ murein hydrolase activator NlpD
MFDPYAPYPASSSRFWKLRNDARAVEVPCRWPLPRLAGRDPIAVPVLDDTRKGVDIGYGPGVLDLAGQQLFIPVYAVRRGDVAFACETINGFAVTLDHGSWCSHYTHMSKMFVTQNLRRTTRLQAVKPGEVIGYAATSPVHVRFEIWERTYTQGWATGDAMAQLKDWTIDRPVESLRSTVAEESKAA